MSKKFLLFALAALSLSACSHLHPVSTEPSVQVQCKALEHQQSMLTLNSTNLAAWQLQTERQQLQEAYHKMHCDQNIKNAEQKTAKKSEKIIYKQMK